MHGPLDSSLKKIENLQKMNFLEEPFAEVKFTYIIVLEYTVLK